MDYELDVDPALASVVLELEKHHAGIGWDQPARLYALVDTAQFVAAEPALAISLGLDDSRERGSLTSIEQDELPPGDRLEDVLGTIGWPPSVAGCAVVVERLVLPPAADGQVPDDPAAAEEFAANHPDRQEVRIVAGVTRGGSAYCAVRLRSEDDDSAVMGGVDVVPNLVAALRDTLLDDGTDDE